MKVFLFSLLLVSLSVGVALGQSTGTITGKVTVEADGSILHQASVRLTELNRNVVTDDNGVYTFTNIPAGRYTILVHQEGFGDVARNITLTAGGTATADFAMRIRGVKEQVTVTASGAEQTTFESIASVSTVDSNTITERAAVGIGDVLDNQAGVNKRSFGPGNSRPVIRGFDGDRVLVSTDGVREGSLASQSPDHAEPVDTMSVERIEVVKGPATLLYGSNAIGGVVNAITGHDEGSHPGFRGYATVVGSTNSGQAVVSTGLEYGYKNWLFWGNGTGQRTNDYSAGGDFGKVENTFTRNAAGSFGTGYFAKKAFVTGSFNYYQNRFGIPVEHESEEELVGQGGHDHELRSLRMWRNNTKVNGGLRDLNSFITSARFTFAHSNYRHQEIHEDEVGTSFRNYVTSYRGIFDQRNYKQLSGRFGFDGFQRSYQTVGDESLVTGKVKQNSFSIFGLEELKYERVTLQFGGRVEHNAYTVQDPTLPNRSFTGFSGAVGARFALWKGGAFVANYSHSFRAPALEELYNYGPHDGTLSFEVGDSSLRPEKSNGIDLSLRQQSDRFRFEWNFYHYAIGNFIFLAPTGEIDGEPKRVLGGTGSGLPIAEYTQANSRFTGTEINLDAGLTSFMNALVGVDYVRAELTDGTPLPRIPPLRGRVGLDLHYKNFSVRPEARFTAGQYRTFTGESATGSNTVLNVAANYVITSKHIAHVFGVNAFNLSNKLYLNHISFIKDISPEIGRGVRFSYTIRYF